MVSQNWVEWKDLIKEGIKDFHFFDYLRAGLEPYDRYTYEHIDCPQKHHRYFHLFDNKTGEHEKREKEMLAILDGDRKAMGDDPNEHPIPRSWKYFVPSTYQECEKIKSDLIERAVFKKDFALNINDVFKTKREVIQDKKKLRPSQRHRIECRKVAKKIWEKDPTLTIAGMCNREEILDVSKRKDGNLYIEKTIRNWIKDLCPDRSPGKRPTKK